MKINLTEEEITYIENMLSCNYGDDNEQPKKEKELQLSVLKKLKGDEK